MAGIRGQTNAFDFATGKDNHPDPQRHAGPDSAAGEPLLWTVFVPCWKPPRRRGCPGRSGHGRSRPRAARSASPGVPFGSDKWVVRSAYGIFYVYPGYQPAAASLPHAAVQCDSQIDQQRRAHGDDADSSRNLANYFLGQPVASLEHDARHRPPVGSIYRSAYTQTWNFNVQHEFANNMAAEVGYVANKGTRLQYGSAGNVPLPGPGNVQARRPYPQWGVFLLQQLGRIEHVPQPAGEGREAVLQRASRSWGPTRFPSAWMAPAAKRAELRPTISTT